MSGEKDLRRVLSDRLDGGKVNRAITDGLFQAFIQRSISLRSFFVGRPAPLSR